MRTWAPGPVVIAQKELRNNVSGVRLLTNNGEELAIVADLVDAQTP